MLDPDADRVCYYAVEFNSINCSGHIEYDFNPLFKLCRACYSLADDNLGSRLDTPGSIRIYNKLLDFLTQNYGKPMSMSILWKNNQAKKKYHEKVNDSAVLDGSLILTWNRTTKLVNYPEM